MSRLRTNWRTIFLGLAVLYSILHFWHSGIAQPNSKPFSGRMMQTRDEMQPLVRHIRDGGPIRSIDPRQYGPVFFFLLHPALLACGMDTPLLCHAVYGMGVVSLMIAFIFCVLSIRLWLNDAYGPRRFSMPLVTLALGLLWFNFSPVYYILSAGVPEMWELALMSIALYSYLRGWRFLASFALVAAALIKMLPAVLLLYFVLRDRRALWYAALSTVVLLSLSQWLYGWPMGYGYPGLVLRNMFGVTHGLTAHENVSIKGMIVKLFAGFKMGGPDGYHLVIDEHALMTANAVAQMAQLAGIAWTVWVLTRKAPASRSGGIVWEWSLLSVMTMLLAPSIAFEYMLLSLLAFSVVLASFVVDPELPRRRLALGCFGVAVLLIANLVPRRIINQLLPVAAISRLMGTSHFTLSEAYQYYGFPLLGMCSLLATLWVIRRRVISN